MAKQGERLNCEGVGVEAGTEVRGKTSVVGDDDSPGRIVSMLDPTDRLVEVTLLAPTYEQAEVLREFGKMLAGVLRDGGRKRAAGTKPSWKVDKSHMPAIYSHLNKHWHGEKADPDSGQHPFVHLACRALMIAWQETHPEEGR